MPHSRFVHIVDDDDAVRRSLERLFYAAGIPTASYPAPSDFVAAATRLHPGCVLLDVRMPGLDGLEVQALLKELGVRAPVIVMTGHGDVQTAVAAMKAGAVDFIEKPFAAEQLLIAVEAALAGPWGPRENGEAADAAERLAALTPRERQVLDGLVAGRANKQIAGDLGISVRTVEVHRARMFERLGVHKLAEAVRLAVICQILISS